LASVPVAASAAATPRYAHTATLLSNGNLLVAGGVNAAGTVINTVELIATGGTIGASNDIFVGSMAVARSSHTATFLPNGNVLVAGGATNAAGTPTATTEIYNPQTQAWTAGPSMATARFNHTATLLQDGRVLLCGGENGPGNVVATCEAYNSVTNTMATVATLNQARSLHSAVLLKDGTVWIAGGWNPAASNSGTNYYLPTTERFNPTTNTFASDVYLIEARAYHSATVMGDGRVAVVGGYNGYDYGSPSNPTDPLHNYGLLDATEIFDPTTDEESPGPTANFRRMMHSAVLFADGTVNLDGGLGNVGPQNIEANLAADSGSMSLTTGGADTIALTNPTSGSPSITLQLPITASGTIVNGEILWLGSTDQPNTTVTFSSGVVSMTLNPTSLDGVIVNCSAGTCGTVNLPATLNVTGVTSGFQQSATPASSPVDLSVYNGTFASSATIVIQEMVLASGEKLNELQGTMTITYQSFVGRYQHTGTLTTSGDSDFVGGRGPSGALSNGGFRIDGVVIPEFGDFTGISGTMSTARAYHTATLLPSGSILVAGGQSAPNAPLATATVFSPTTGVFTPTPSTMSLSRSNHTATLLTNGRVLIAGGFTNQTSTAPTNVAEIYYPNTQLFVPTASMTYARGNHTATLMPDGSVIVLGGNSSSGGYLNTVEQYSPNAVTWTTLNPMPVALSNQTATLLTNGDILVIGGKTASGPSNAAYLFNPTADTWTTLASMPTALYDHTATLMFDGRVLVAGGNDGLGSTYVSYIYNPGSNTWAATCSGNCLTQARSGHTATLLPNNTVMITGGIGNPTPTYVEVFRIDGSSWAPVGVFPAARTAHTMTLALNGLLYAIGGYTGTSYYASALSGDFTLSPDAETTGAPPSLRQSSITAISAYPFQQTSNLTVSGTTFEGGTEASGGGAASMSSSFSFPHLLLQQFGSSGGSSSQSDPGFAVDLTTQVYLNSANASTLNTSLTVPTPVSPQLPYGWYAAHVGANDIYSKAQILQVGPALPTAAPTGLTGVPLGVSSISWTWAWGGGAIGGFDVYQASSSVFIGTAAAASPSFIQTGLQPNTTGAISVAAYTLSGDGPLEISTTFYTFPAAPSLVQLSSVTPNSVLVQWNLSNNAPGTFYEIDQSTDDFVTSFSTPVPASLDVTTNSYIVGSLLASTTYWFRMRAINQGGLASGFSNVVSTETTSGVGGVSGVALSANSIQWSWTATPGATLYDVFVTTTGQLTGTTTTTVFIDSNLAVDTARGVSVGAVTGAGLGPLSASATIYTLADSPGPEAPQYVNLSTGGFVVNWTNNGNPPNISYQVNIFAIEPVGGVETLVESTVTTNAQFYGATGLSPARLADVYVSAINGNGILSAPYVLSSTYTLANPPSGLSISGTTPNSISVAWSVNSNSTSTYYQLTYSTNDFVTNVTTAVTFANGQNVSSATIGGLLTSTTYWITVQAENALGQLTSFANTVSTITTNGGAPLGQLEGVLPAQTTGQIAGNLGNGEYVSLASPSGAFPYDTTVVISSFNVLGPICPGAVNLGIYMSATPALLPSRELLLSLGYTPAELGAIPPSEATIFRYVPSEGVCVPLNTTVNTSTLLLTAQVNDFGYFVIGLPTVYGSADSARAYPNPYHVNRDGYVTIDQIPAGSRVRILDLRGDTVLDQTANQSGLITWSATNGAGRGVASGLYLVIIEGNGTKKIIKMAVIR